jgi:hypothetical protein
MGQPAQNIEIASDEEVGSLGVLHLKRLWSRYLANRFLASPPDEGKNEWAADNTLISGLGLGLHETLRYLYTANPSFERLEQWVLERNGGSIEPARIERINAALRGETVKATTAPGVNGPLSDQDMAFWQDNGYVVLHDAAPAEGCAAAVKAICEFLDMDLGNPSTWYNGPQGHSIWVPLLRHPAIEANRASERIHRAFEQIWERTDLWMTIDQCGMNPPERPGWQFPGPFLHWDTSLALPIPFGVQGILYLTDTPAEQGAFTCVPGFHRKIESWLKDLPEGVDPRERNLESLGAIPIPGKAGDLIIWQNTLPHGSRPNRAALPRFVQYLAMRPPDFGTNMEWR